MITRCHFLLSILPAGGKMKAGKRFSVRKEKKMKYRYRFKYLFCELKRVVLLLKRKFDVITKITVIDFEDGLIANSSK